MLLDAPVDFLTFEIFKSHSFRYTSLIRITLVVKLTVMVNVLKDFAQIRSLKYFLRSTDFPTQKYFKDITISPDIYSHDFLKLFSLFTQNCSLIKWSSYKHAFRLFIFMVDLCSKNSASSSSNDFLFFEISQDFVLFLFGNWIFMVSR